MACSASGFSRISVGFHPVPHRTTRFDNLRLIILDALQFSHQMNSNEMQVLPLSIDCHAPAAFLTQPMLLRGGGCRAMAWWDTAWSPLCRLTASLVRPAACYMKLSCIAIKQDLILVVKVPGEMCRLPSWQHFC